MYPDPGLTIILLGNSGVGKSATGNSILGGTAFVSKRSFKPVTTNISEATETVCGRQISVVDTPGILAPGSEQKIRDWCQNQLRSSRSCVFLVVVKIDRFTEEQEKAVNTAVSVIGEQGLDRSFLLFTYGETVDRVEDFIYEDDECPLPRLVEGLFKNKYLAFNNKDGGQKQVRELLNKSGYPPPVALVDWRMVLFGLSGCGKSSTGNTILGLEHFRSGCDFNAVSTECQSSSASVEGRRVTLLDTPGLNDERVSPGELGRKILNALRENGLGIHAFVIVVKLGRVCNAEIALLKHLPTLFGRNAAKYTMVLFTHGDELRGQSVDDMITSKIEMSELVSMCCGRYCVFDNRDRRNRLQVKTFLDKVDEMVTFNGGVPCLVDVLHVATDFSGSLRSWDRSSQMFEGEDVPRGPTCWETFLDLIARLICYIRQLFSRERNSPYRPLLAYQQ